MADWLLSQWRGPATASSGERWIGANAAFSEAGIALLQKGTERRRGARKPIFVRITVIESQDEVTGKVGSPAPPVNSWEARLPQHQLRPSRHDIIRNLSFSLFVFHDSFA